MPGAQDYLTRLEQLVSEEAEPNKERLLGTVTDLFFLTKHQHTDDDIAIFGVVMEQLAYRVQLKPRADFAERIADSDRAARRLLLRLATDEIQVARPVLERSVCICEDDLVEIARSSSLAHLCAISSRAAVTPPITDVIVPRGDDEVLVRLASNARVEFSRRGYAGLLARAAMCQELREIVETRGVVGRDLWSRLWLYSLDLREKFARRNSVGDVGLKRLVVALPADHDGRAANSPSDPEQAAESEANLKLAAAGLLEHARAKNVAEVLKCLCILSGADQTKVRHMLLQAHVNAFGIFCRAHKIDSTTFAALLQLRVSTGDLDTGHLIDALRR